MTRRSRSSRRQVLSGLGGSLIALGGISYAINSGAFSSTTADRNAGIAASADSAFVVRSENGSVQKNQREFLVNVENNTASTFDITVSLDDSSPCTNNDITLYDPSDNQGCPSVSFTITSGTSASADIEPEITGTFSYTVSITSPGVSYETSPSVDVVAGNNKGAITINQLDKFSPDTKNDTWTVDKIQVKDSDGDDDLDRIEFEIVDGSSNTRATRTDDCSDGNVDCQNGAQYNPKSVTLEPNDSNYTVTDEEYQLTVTAYDKETPENFDSDTVTYTP